MLVKMPVIKGIVIASVMIGASIGMPMASPAWASASSYLSFDGGAVKYKRGDWEVNFQGDLTIKGAPAGYTSQMFEHYQEGLYLVDAKNSAVTFDCGETSFNLAESRTVFADFRCQVLNDEWSNSSRGSGTYNLVYKASISYGNDLFPIILKSGLTFPKVVTKESAFVISRSSVVAGSQVTIVPKVVSYWSDNVSTSICTDGAKVQYRPIGTYRWLTATQMKDIGRSFGCPQVFRGAASRPADYRLLRYGTVTKSQYLAVARQSSGRKIATVTTSARSVIAGSVVSFSSSMKSLYDDGVWRGAPKGTIYVLQFLPAGSGVWKNKVIASVARPGQLRVRFPVTASGSWRFAAKSARSIPTRVQVRGTH